MKRILAKQKNIVEYDECLLCARACAVNRNLGETGVCGVSSQLRVARAALHMWEEPCISGTCGSGAIFFSGCALHCVFCQNESIAQAVAGKDISRERLVEIMLELQDKGANNINLVTPTQYVPDIIWGVEQARNQGLKCPIVYNTSSFENVDTLRALEGIVDVYLPDFKYMDSQLSLKYSHSREYPDIAKAAIREMVRQQPTPVFYKEGENYLEAIQNGHTIAEHEDGYLMAHGVIVRQLLLPGQVRDAKDIVRYLHETYGDHIYLSMMSQYTPLEHVKKYPELDRKVTQKEYDEYIDYAIDLGVEEGFLQEEDVAEESFIPHFDNEGV